MTEGESWPSGGVTAATNILCSLNLESHLIIDVGAHEGETVEALHASHLASIRCISIEPNPESFVKLQLNSQILKDKGFEVELLQSAVGSKLGAQTFLLTDQSAVAGLLEPFSGVSARVPTGDHEIVKRFNVDVVTIDSLLSSRGLTQVDLLKIDTEGFDLEVLKGASETLGKNMVSVVLCETFFVNYRKDQCFFWDIASFMHQFSYYFVGLYDTRQTSQGRLYTGNGIWVSLHVGQSLGFL